MSDTTTDRPVAAASDRSRAARSPWGTTRTSARASRHPSMIEAWLSSSEWTTTPPEANTDNTDRLAANPVGKMTAASVPFQSASAASRS